ncbi:uncharacterized protein BCR38DRAFT_394242 [Pseudomassariella vexata]|uniref:Amidohydrolase-related domain-containing protein n=1 Tax=Pseudomassariella vexata TaxID=1141098 RepID=A0A1Y2DVR5_9PEZI|nr:uncharacterized protein BCR38DRAFT_394242 [Pseudomassariella vexata]ORY63361.1 hypothetical protein BCR38DRAFT_394242 [Pseudomassariella vexata]
MALISTNPTGRHTCFLNRMPKDAWDSHMHVVDPTAYPLSADAAYTPSSHTVEEAMDFEKSVGLDNIVLVQPSIYGHDNSCMLDAMRALGPSRCRGVVSLDPRKTSPATLQKWHDLGVRGARINLQSVGKSLDGPELEAALMQYAEVLRPLQWTIQLYVPMRMITLLEPIVPKLGVRICIDHIGHPTLPGPDEYQETQDPYKLPGFESLIRLLEEGQTFVKLSAAYRISAAKDGMSDLAPIAQEILRVAGKRRVVFATDWPHTRFTGLDIRPWMEQVLEWCGNDDKLIDRVFRGNAEDLWMVKREGR